MSLYASYSNVFLSMSGSASLNFTKKPLLTTCDGRTTYYSPLVMNVILAGPCHAYADVYKEGSGVEHREPTSLTYPFLAEARRLLELESTKNASLTTIVRSR